MDDELTEPSVKQGNRDRYIERQLGLSIGSTASPDADALAELEVELCIPVATISPRPPTAVKHGTTAAPASRVLTSLVVEPEVSESHRRSASVSHEDVKLDREPTTEANRGVTYDSPAVAGCQRRLNLDQVSTLPGQFPRRPHRGGA